MPQAIQVFPIQVFRDQRPFELKLPHFPQILSVGRRCGEPCFWARVPTGDSVGERGLFQFIAVQTDDLPEMLVKDPYHYWSFHGTIERHGMPAIHLFAHRCPRPIPQEP
mgnify:FL=1